MCQLTRGETVRITGEEEKVRAAELVIRALHEMVQKE